jgi:hypothetical protein
MQLRVRDVCHGQSAKRMCGINLHYRKLIGN